VSQASAAELNDATDSPDAEPSGLSWRRVRRWVWSPRGWLVVVCLAHVVAAELFVAIQHMSWQQDEVVYLSQVAAHLPALAFTPPRARGLPVLLYPVGHFTTRIVIVRSYVAILGGLLLYIGFVPWLRLGYDRIVAVAALLFGGLWVTSYIGASLQPDYTVAALSLGVVGYYVLALREPSKRRPLIVIGGLLALLALVRPSDATWLTIPLLLALLAMRSSSARQRLVVGATLVAGLVLGWSEWVIEAYASYGGFFQRLHDANAENTPGVHFSLLTQARAVNGPLLCRPCTNQPLSVWHVAWWLVAVPLIVIGLAAARRTQRLVPLVVATACGAALLLEYVLTVSYAAPRFLLPAYALLALPAATGVVALTRWRPRTTAHLAVVAAVVAVFGVQLATQTVVLHNQVASETAIRANYPAAARILRHHGVHAPCVVYGTSGPPVAFALGCQDFQAVLSTTLSHVPTGTTVVAFTNRAKATVTYRGWRKVPIDGTVRYQRWVAHVLIGGQPLPKQINAELPALKATLQPVDPIDPD
jgi:hypothetical protein